MEISNEVLTGLIALISLVVGLLLKSAHAIVFNRTKKAETRLDGYYESIEQEIRGLRERVAVSETQISAMEAERKKLESRMSSLEILVLEEVIKVFREEIFRIYSEMKDSHPESAEAIEEMISKFEKFMVSLRQQYVDKFIAEQLRRDRDG